MISVDDAESALLRAEAIDYELACYAADDDATVEELEADLEFILRIDFSQETWEIFWPESAVADWLRMRMAGRRMNAGMSVDAIELLNQ